MMQFILRELSERYLSDRNQPQSVQENGNFHTYQNYALQLQPQKKGREWREGGGEGLFFFMKWRNGMVGVCM